MADRSLHEVREDELVPLESLSLREIRSFVDLLRAMSKTAFAGRQLGEAFEILLEMARNEPLRRECARRGRAEVESRFDIRGMVCDLDRLYLSLMEGTR